MKLEKKIPTVIGETYYQNWIAGVKGGGSGINVFIETRNKAIVLDSIYFRGDIVKLETKPADEQLYIGRFITEANSNQNQVIATLEEKPKVRSFPFELKSNECVVSYKDGGKIKYFKILDLKEKPVEALPMSTPPNKN